MIPYPKITFNMEKYRKLLPFYGDISQMLCYTGRRSSERSGNMARNVVCFGDSNTYGYCGDPGDCADGVRFSGEERWTGLLQKKLGEGFRICEEGVVGRTTAFDDPMRPGMNGLKELPSVLKGYGTVDLLILMLGTNDTKERFASSAECISIGMERLIAKAKSVECWTNGKPNILLIAPPHILDGLYDGPFGGSMGTGCPQKSRELANFYQAVAQRRGCAFLDAEGVAEFNRTDCMHLTRKGHAALAQKLAQMVPQLVSNDEKQSV